MPEYTVKQGDCTSSLAHKSGLFWETIWSHPQNAALKSSRKDPNILFPGDKIFIPEKERKQADCASDQRHRFQRKGVPTKLRLKLLKDKEEDEQPYESQEAPGNEAGENFFKGGDPENVLAPKEQELCRNVDYILVVDGVLLNGQTDGEGMIEVTIPENARQGELTLNPGTEQEKIIKLDLGVTNPVDMVSGVKQRLSNLMLYIGEIDEQETQELETALRRFQQMHDLDMNGRIDQSTKDKLLDVHGS